MVWAELDIGTIGLQAAILTVLFINRSVKLGETPFLRDEDLLTSGELELGSAQGFNDSILVFDKGADANDGLSNVYSCNCTLGFTKGTTHSSLEPISSSAAQHLVDADHMKGMNSHPNVESVFAAVLNQVLVNQTCQYFSKFKNWYDSHYFVGANTAGFKGFRWKLFILIGHQMNAEGEVFYASLLATQIENTNFRVGDTTIESWFGVRLIFAVAVAVRIIKTSSFEREWHSSQMCNLPTSRTTSHLDNLNPK